MHLTIFFYVLFFFFFNDTATTEIYTLSLHDALPIPHWPRLPPGLQVADQDRGVHQRYKMRAWPASEGDRLGKREGQVGAFRHEAGLQASGNGGGLSRNGVVKQGLAVRWRRVLEIRA